MNLTDLENKVWRLQNSLTPAGKREFAKAFFVDYSPSCEDCRKVAKCFEDMPQILEWHIADGIFTIPSDIEKLERFSMTS